MHERDLLKLIVELARTASLFDKGYSQDPKPGDLVVEVTTFRDRDPDAIGWLVGHGDAPYNVDDPDDGSVPMREVWDIVPLCSEAVLNDRGEQRWENATFRAINPTILRRAGVVRRAT